MAASAEPPALLGTCRKYKVLLREDGGGLAAGGRYAHTNDGHRAARGQQTARTASTSHSFASGMA